MKSLEEFFGHDRRILLPVIHCVNPDQATKNARVAMRSGADGVFLINHQMNASELLECWKEVHISLAGSWVGLNFLDLPDPIEAFQALPSCANGLWVDNAKMSSSSENIQAIENVRERTASDKLYFGGVEFKYQNAETDLGSALKVAMRYMDVITTSGPGTGQAASIEKVQTIREQIGEFPLALASGITAGNIKEFHPYVDCYLVSTGISLSFTELDPYKVTQLAELIHTKEL